MGLPAKATVHDPNAESVIREVSRLVQEATGVQLGDRQRVMVEARLLRRLSELGLADFAAYLRYLRTNIEHERPSLISLLTTHHTFFFREFEQFEYLRSEALPALAAALKAERRSHLNVWCMACSRGHEAYTLAMFLGVHWHQALPGGTFSILATDVDPESVKVAKNGVYHLNEIKSIPSLYSQGHWQRGTGDIAHFARAKASLRDRLRFGTSNLLALPAPAAGEAFDLIFCRNVFIYFTPEQISGIVPRIAAYMTRECRFMIGTTESLSSLNLPLKAHKYSVYVRPEVPAKAATTETSPAQAGASTAAKLIRVFCVDDSPTIHTLLGSILTPAHGFAIVGKAMNGQEALDRAATTAFDIMTLDLHMPIKTGIEYLAARRREGHPPVVVLSSVARDEAGYGEQVFQLGATDYIEKPALSTLEERSDEIRTKLRCAALAAASGQTETVSIAATAFARDRTTPVTPLNPSRGLRVICFGPGDRHRLHRLLVQLRPPQPPTLLIADAAAPLLASLAAELRGDLALALVVAEGASVDTSADCKNQVLLVDLERAQTLLEALAAGRRIVKIIYDSVSLAAIKAVRGLSPGVTILEERADTYHPNQSERQALVTQTVPETSLLHDSNYLLSQG